MMDSLRTKLPALLLTALLALLWTPADAAPVTEAADDSAVIPIDIFDFGYMDSTASPVTVASVGDTVVWTNVGSLPHTATHGVAVLADGALTPPATGGFDSGVLGSGGSFSATLGESGVFAYYCQLHENMRGVLVVL